MQWLLEKTHLLAHHRYREKYMASAIECVYRKCQKIKELPALILQQTSTMNILPKLHKKLPEIKEYLNWYWGEKNESGARFQQRKIVHV